MKRLFVAIPATGELLSVRANSRHLQVHGDILGSPLAFSSVTGSVVEVFEFGAFGRPVISMGGIVVDRSTEGVRIGYGGLRFEPDFELTAHFSRFSSWDEGRFIQEEVLGFDGPNRYILVLNNPVRLRDPTGDAAEGALFGGIAGGIIGAYFGGAGGTIVGGTVGTLIAPGVGTLAGGFVGLNLGALQGALLGSSAGALAGSLVQDYIALSKGKDVGPSSDPEVRDADDEEVKKRARNRKDPKWEAFKREAKRRRKRRSGRETGGKGCR